ncbi:MAG: zinc-binding dehydrogenase [Phycisphaeraceae bacterium]|nr:zinc-binding dehydrogenase [Phycisphaeraceae bacterium]MCW5754240.1 zinc-binding dehydrogenase [Phycisphaeraceae bacterium]
MKAIICTRQGSPVAPNIHLGDWPDEPPPPPGHALIRTLASALNHMDLWVGKGIPGINLTWPRISGCDACGVVEAVGPDVDPTWVGQRVIVNAAIAQPLRPRPLDPPATTLAPEYQLIGEHHHGMLRERFTAPVSNLAPVGETDPVQAAAFGLTMLTAYSMIVTKGSLRSGQTVLITGIGGGVATSSLKIAKFLGCPVCVTSRHQWKLDKAAELGADCGILDRSTPDSPDDWFRQVRAWTNKRGVDMAVDSTGKATHLNCIKSLARGGAYVTPGCTSGPDATTDLARIYWNQLRILGSTMGTNDEFAELTSLLRARRLTPIVDQVFTPQQCRQAYERLEAGEQFGKVVVKWE